MARRQLSIAAERFPLAHDFVISRGRRSEAEVVTVTIGEGGIAGRGEGTPIIRYGQTQASVIEEIEAIRRELESGLGRKSVQDLMAAGPARNAVDCALWDLEAKRTGRSVWQLCDILPPRSILTAYTLSLDRPDRMAEAALGHRRRPLIKLKLGGDGHDIDRVAAVRNVLPRVRLIVDANEAIAEADLDGFYGAARELGVELIEQPLPAGRDAALGEIGRSIATAADESCHTEDDIDGLRGRYDVVNIKLDKSGGLTAALALKQRAKRRGFGIMVGCMVSTSLGVAPAQMVAAGASFVDLDSPLYLSADRDHALAYDGSEMMPADRRLWG